MIFWGVIILFCISVIFASLQTFRLQERELFITYQKRVIKQMERNDIVAKEFQEFLDFHKTIREELNLPHPTRQTNE